MAIILNKSVRSIISRKSGQEEYARDTQGRFYRVAAGSWDVPEGTAPVTDVATLYELGIDTPKLADYLKSINASIPTNIEQQVIARSNTYTPYTGPGSIPQTTSISQPTTPKTTPLSPLTTEQLVAQSKAMIEQTRAEGSKPFKGSSYDIINAASPTPTPASTPTPPISPITTPVVAPTLAPTPPVLPTPTALPIQDTYAQSMAVKLDADRKAVQDTYQKQLDTLKTQSETAQAKIDELTAKEKAMIETDVQPLMQPFRETLEKTERERLKTEENYFANQTLTNELGTLLTDIQADIQREKDVTGLAAIREPRIAKAKEDAMGRVGVIEAVMAARNNQITVANNLIDRSITAITADRTDKLNYFNTLLTFYTTQKTEEGKKLLAITTEQKDWLKSQVGLLESDLASSQASVDYVKKLLSDPATALLAGEAGLRVNMTPQEMNTALANAAYLKDKREYIKTMALDEKALISEAEAALKPQNEISIIPDARGNNMYFWKKESATETGTQIDTRQYIQDPNNPTASIPNPNYGQPMKGATPVKLTADQKAITYDQIKTRAEQLFADGATQEEYQQMKDEIISYGLGGYIDDFDKFAQPLLPAKTLTPDEIKIEIIKTLQPQKDIYTRAEAKTAAENQLMSALGLKTGQVLPQSYKDIIEDALVEVYGRTFWQKVLPGGR